jgi:predicted TIM-barrel fold metal-dependent hydrolase
MEIIDTHHHLWDLDANHYPWLSPSSDAPPLPNFADLCQNYLVDDFRAEFGRHDIVKSVHVQAEHDESEPVRETAWLQQVADDPASGGFPHAIVAYADLSEPDVERVLVAHRQYPNVRGIRQSLNYDPQSQAGVAAAPIDFLTHDGWLAGFELLRKHDLSFDLQCFPWQLAGAADLAARQPDTQLILNHTGMPVPINDGNDLWRRGMRTLAQCPNVVVKISGLALFSAGDQDLVRSLATETLTTFGPERCMFASNFPVDKMVTSYDTIWSTFREITSLFSEDEQRALFRDNAERIYR